MRRLSVCCVWRDEVVGTNTSKEFLAWRIWVSENWNCVFGQLR